MPPFLKLVRKGSNIDFVGPVAEYLKNALRLSNISYMLIQSPEVRLGTELSQGNVTGIMKMLHENEADMALNPYSVSPLRLKYMDLSTPLYYTTYTTLSGYPRGVVRHMDNLLNVFHNQVWIWLVLTALLLSVLFRILSHFEKHKRDNWIFYFLIFFGSLTRQEFPLRLYVGHKERALIFLFWLIGSFCLSSAFLAVFLSFVTICEKPVRIDSAEDIVKYPDVKPLILRDSIDTISIMNSRNPTIVQLWRQIERHKSQVTHIEMLKPDNLEKTCRGLSVMLSEIYLLRISVRFGCVPGSQYYIAKNPYLHTALAYGMKKGFPYAFKYSLTKLFSLFVTTHQYEHWLNRATMSGTECLDSVESRESENVVKQLSMKNFKHSFWWLSFGLIFSFLIFVLELLNFLLV